LIKNKKVLDNFLIYRPAAQSAQVLLFQLDLGSFIYTNLAIWTSKQHYNTWDCSKTDFS